MHKTVSKIIKELKKLPQDLPVFFDCPHCGRANIFNMVRVSAVIETEYKKKENHQDDSL